MGPPMAPCQLYELIIKHETIQACRSSIGDARFGAYDDHASQLTWSMRVRLDYRPYGVVGLSS